MGEKQIIHIRRTPKKMSQVRLRMRRRQRKNRLAAAAVILILGIVCLLFAGRYLRPKSRVSTLTLQKNGQVDLEEVVSLKGTGASESDLKTSVRASVKKYNQKHGRNAVQVRRFSHVKGKLYVETRYRDTKTYQDYSGYTLFSGTVKQARAAGYDFNDSFVRIRNSGKKGWKKAEAADTALVTKNEKNKVLIIRENIRVRIDGDLRYLTDSGTKVVSRDTVSISPEDGNADNRQLTYLIY